MSAAERTCMICQFPCEKDDQVVTGAYRAVCARCFARETGANVHRMPKGLRRDVEATLAGIAHSSWIPE